MRRSSVSGFSSTNRHFSSPPQGQAPARVRARQTRVSAPQTDATDCLGRRGAGTRACSAETHLGARAMRNAGLSRQCMGGALVGIATNHVKPLTRVREVAIGPGCTIYAIREFTADAFVAKL